MYLNYGPVKVMLPIGQNCNLKCQMCPVIRSRGHTQNKDVSLSTFRKFFLPVAEYATSISLYSQGEPLMHPDYEKMLYYTHMNHPEATIHISTNGLLLNKYWRTLIIDYACAVNISVNAGTNATYTKITGGGNLPKVIQNIRSLISDKQTSTISLSYVLQKDNVTELPQFVTQAINLGVDSIAIWDLIVYHDAHYPFVIDKKIDLTSIYLEAKALADSANMELSVFAGIPYFKIPDYDPVCREPWQTVCVTALGDVYPCCYSSKSYGNIFTQTIQDIWNSSDYQELRATVNSDSMPKICKKCPRKLNHFKE